MPKNLIDEVWGTERPARPNNKLIVLEQKYAGKPFQEKLEALRKEMEKKKSPGFVVSMLDEIAWLYNLRGSEYVSSIPGYIFMAYHPLWKDHAESLVLY